MLVGDNFGQYENKFFVPADFGTHPCQLMAHDLPLGNREVVVHQRDVALAILESS